MEAAAKAYGKILVFGAYAILEPGNVGLVVNVNKGTTTSVQETDSGKIVIDLSNFEIVVQGIIKNNKLCLDKDPDTIKFIKKAVEYSYQYIQNKRLRIKDVRVISYNDPELSINKNLKTGFGSSATSTVSTVAALLKIHDIDDRQTVYKISRYAHYKAQGDSGSGFDISCACTGSHFFLSDFTPLDENFNKYMTTDKPLIRLEFDWPHTLIPVLVFTGVPASTTELVKKVNEFKETNFYQYKKFMYEYNQTNLAAKTAFDENYLNRIKFFLEKSWDLRKQLGKMAKAPIEPEPMSHLIEEMKKHGALIAGLTGAGGGDSILAICKSNEDKDELIKFLDRLKLNVMDEIQIINKEYEIIK